MRRLVLCALLVLATLLPSRARAHWCDDLWGSAYNVVVRPVSDTVDVPASGAATLDIYVQNNMGYPLKNFTLSATAAGYTIAITRQQPKVPSFLMPGERLRHTLAITGGAGALPVETISFGVRFGDGSQSRYYPWSGAQATVIRKNDGTLWPPRPLPSLGAGHGQALHLRRAAAADFGDLGASLDLLMTEYCAGRGSWDTGGGGSLTQYCTGTATQCPSPVNRGDTKFDWQHLWAVQELVSRRSALGARAAPLRARLQCAWDDNLLAFKAFAAFSLGYLGPDASARTFLEGKIASGSADEQAIARAALLLLGDPADRTAHHAAVVAAAGRGTGTLADELVSSTAAAALGILDGDDARVEGVLIPRSKWAEPDCGPPCGDSGRGFFASHLLAVVAWDRRGWATDAGDTGRVSFFEPVAADTTPPAAPTGTVCTASVGGGARVGWNQVTTDEAGGSETLGAYRVYYAYAPRPGACVRPGDAACAWDHSDATTAIYRDYTGLDAARTYHFSVAAIDAAGNQGAFSNEARCTPRYAPAAVLRCTPLTGTAPLDVVCDGNGSSDPNGAADLAGFTFSLDGGPEEAGAPTSRAYRFDQAGAHTVVLRVTDAGGLSDTDQATLSVGSAGNQPPLALAAASPTSGQAPLSVQYSSAGSADPDAGQTIAFHWDFGDASASTDANPVHVFQAPGTYRTVLTVTDDFSTPASATALVDVTVTGNSPPDLGAVSATPLWGPAPLTVTFDASGATDPDGNDFVVSYDFGDGSPAAAQRVVEHTYADEGTYLATLTAVDDARPTEGRAEKVFTIEVGGEAPTNLPPDCAGASVAPSSGPVPLAVTLNAEACTDPDGDALAFSWRIPTSLTTEDRFEVPRVDYTFEEPGEYVLTLRVSDSTLETSREFRVAVGSTDDLQITGGCGCSAAGPGAGAALLLLAGLALRRRG